MVNVHIDFGWTRATIQKLEAACWNSASTAAVCGARIPKSPWNHRNLYLTWVVMPQNIEKIMIDPTVIYHNLSLHKCKYIYIYIDCHLSLFCWVFTNIYHIVNPSISIYHHVSPIRYGSHWSQTGWPPWPKNVSGTSTDGYHLRGPYGSRFVGRHRLIVIYSGLIMC